MSQVKLTMSPETLSAFAKGYIDGIKSIGLPQEVESDLCREFMSKSGYVEFACEHASKIKKAIDLGKYQPEVKDGSLVLTPLKMARVCDKCEETFYAYTNCKCEGVPSGQA